MIFGAAYYPEQWKPKDWEEDIQIMKSMGTISSKTSRVFLGFDGTKRRKI
jgi:beta-galactosidase GanA